MNRPSVRQPMFGIYDDLLPSEVCAEMLASALARRDLFRPATVYRETRAAIASEQRAACHIRFPQDPAFSTLLARVTSMRGEIFDRLGMAAFDVLAYETEVVAHGDGDYFKAHRDTVVKPGIDGSPGVRLVSCVYYFSPSPLRFSGGSLRIFDMFDATRWVDVEPTPNRLVVFPSFILHEVTRIGSPSHSFADSRFSVNIWLRR